MSNTYKYFKKAGIFLPLFAKNSFLPFVFKII